MSCSAQSSWKENEARHEFNIEVICAKYTELSKALPEGDEGEIIDINTLTIVPGTEKLDGTGFSLRDFGVDSPILTLLPDEHPGRTHDENGMSRGDTRKRKALPMTKSGKRRKVTAKTSPTMCTPGYRVNMPSAQVVESVTRKLHSNITLEHFKKGVLNTSEGSVVLSACRGHCCDDFEKCVSVAGSPASLAVSRPSGSGQRPPKYQAAFEGDDNVSQYSGYAFTGRDTRSTVAAATNRPRRLAMISLVSTSLVRKDESRAVDDASVENDKKAVAVLGEGYMDGELMRSVRRSSRINKTGQLAQGSIVVCEKFRGRKSDLELLKENGFKITPGIPFAGDFTYQRRLIEMPAFHFNDDTMSMRSGYLGLEAAPQPQPIMAPQFAQSLEWKEVVNPWAAHTDFAFEPLVGQDSDFAEFSSESRSIGEQLALDEYCKSDYACTLELPGLDREAWIKRWVQETRKLVKTGKYLKDACVEELNKTILSYEKAYTDTNARRTAKKPVVYYK